MARADAIVAEDPERAVRAIIMIVDNALGVLYRAGWERSRDSIDIEQSDGVLPMWVTMKGRRVFMVDVELQGGRPGIRGKWLTKRMPRPNIFRRIAGWIKKKIRESKDA